MTYLNRAKLDCMHLKFLSILAFVRSDASSVAVEINKKGELVDVHGTAGNRTQIAGVTDPND